MNFLEYQAAALRTAPERTQVEGLVKAFMGIMKEGGEFGSEVYRMKEYNKPMTEEMHKHMCEELGDGLWYVAQACDHLGVSMHQIAQQNISKLAARYPEKYSDAAAEARADKGGLGHRES